MCSSDLIPSAVEVVEYGHDLLEMRLIECYQYRFQASRKDSGLYIARPSQVTLAEGQVALAATIISLQERDGAPHYNEPDKPDNLMYMGHFGVATNDDAWKRHFIGIIKQARSDFGNKKVTGLGAGCRAHRLYKPRCSEPSALLLRNHPSALHYR